MIYSENELKSRIKSIIKSFFGIDVLDDTALVGRENRLVARDLLVIFLEIEKVFKIKFEEDDILEYGFKTVNTISKALYSKL